VDHKSLNIKNKKSIVAEIKINKPKPMLRRGGVGSNLCVYPDGCKCDGSGCPKWMYFGECHLLKCDHGVCKLLQNDTNQIK